MATGRGEAATGPAGTAAANADGTVGTAAGTGRNSAGLGLVVAAFSCLLSPVQLLHDVSLSFPPDLPRQL